jgi:hypothetical protein
MADKGAVKTTKAGVLYGATLAFAGMNFMADPASLTIESGMCTDIKDCDVDNYNNVSRRNGFKKIAYGDIANAWSNGDNVFCTLNGYVSYMDFVDATTVEIITFNDTPVLLGNVVFKQVNDIVYFTDGHVAGIIDALNMTIFADSYFNLE